LVKVYFDNTFGVFESTFYYSNLLTEIKNFSKAIISVRAEYSISLVNALNQPDFLFENHLVPGSIRSNEVRLVGSTKFEPISDNKKDGKLYVGDIQVGTVDYQSGKILVDTNKIQETPNGILEIFATPLEEDVTPGFASAIILNKNRLSIELKTV
jgi:hypothetical protein